jgi:hypothetical protein
MTAPSKQTKARSKAQQDAYETLAPGVRMHKESGDVFIWGMLHSKEVKKKGDYGEDTRKTLTKAKDHIRKNHLRSSKFRQYKVDGVKDAKISGDTMEQIVIER